MIINCKGNLIDLNTPKVMGILNITNDSFYDGGRFINGETILAHVEKMLSDGADIIDIGGYSSRPGAPDVSEAEEMHRVIPVIQMLVSTYPDIIISVDTFRSNIAIESIEKGASIINDISAGNLDAKMFQTVAALQIPYIMMHMRGTPLTMQQLTQYTDIVSDLLFYFSEKISIARDFGINDLILDPGFGFAKTLEQNYEVLKKLDLFAMTGLPILAGFSRKSMVYKPLESDAESALNGTSVLNTLALSKGAKILRVHDVKEAVECVKLFNLIA